MDLLGISLFLPCVQFKENWDLLGVTAEPDCLRSLVPNASGTTAGGVFALLWGFGLIGGNVISSWAFIPLGLSLCWLAEFRGVVRTAKNIKGTRVGDCVCSLFCSPCVLMQQYDALKRGASAGGRSGGAAVEPPPEHGAAAMFRVNRM